jgi:hypothetical protein
VFGRWRHRRRSNGDAQAQSTHAQLVEVAQLVGRLNEVAERFEHAADRLIPAIEQREQERGRSDG